MGLTSLGPVKFLKRKILGTKKGTQTIKSGILKGVKFDLDLSCQVQVLLGLSEREIFGWMNKLSANIQTALDIGAGDGQYTLYFMLKTRAKKVFAFEPLDYLQRKIRSNLELNTLDTSRLQIIGKYVNSYVDANEVTLDSLIPQFKFPMLIKLDVDTLEGKVLEGAKQLLCMPHVHWIIETHSLALEEECIRVLKANGYRTKVIKNAWWRVFIPELRPIGHNRWLVAVGHDRAVTLEPHKQPPLAKLDEAAIPSYL